MDQVESKVEIIKYYTALNSFFMKAKVDGTTKWYIYDEYKRLLRGIKYTDYETFTYKYTGEVINNRNVILEMEDFVDLWYDKLFSY